ncbi:LOW QUALITY PROTEIN: C2orf91 isoform 2 [Pongo abelii]|uniref:C2orf91 isoform 2 n=1 Tax=Pongo abelii TaxID=9601 RepID=A0A2J8XDN3_PONAB|nr:LOW QUALITY PROTEIN: C2orf91 isoform 2 [Pongo abelii]
MVRMSRPLFLDWPWRPLCRPSQSLPLPHGPEGWILQWKGTCRQQTALHCPFDFPQAPLRGRHPLSQVPNKGHEKASAVQLPEKQGTDQSKRGPTSVVTKARTSYPESETLIVYLCSYFWNSNKGLYMSGST